MHGLLAPASPELQALKNKKKSIRPQAFKPSSGWARPIKYKKKNLHVDRLRALGYSGILPRLMFFR